MAKAKHDLREALRRLPESTFIRLRQAVEDAALVKAQEIVARGSTQVDTQDRTVGVGRFMSLFGLSQAEAEAVMDYSIRMANMEVLRLIRARGEA